MINRRLKNLIHLLQDEGKDLQIEGFEGLKGLIRETR